MVDDEAQRGQQKKKNRDLKNKRTDKIDYAFPMNFPKFKV